MAKFTFSRQLFFVCEQNSVSKANMKTRIRDCDVVGCPEMLELTASIFSHHII